MKNYNVNEIAKLLVVSEETVRRWIRSGKLKATQTSRKAGSVVDESNLYEFIKTKPKYRNVQLFSEKDRDYVVLEQLKRYLDDLINERDQLNERITRLQYLLGES